MVNQFEMPFELRQKAIDIVAFDGVVASAGGKKCSHPITLEIGNISNKNQFALFAFQRTLHLLTAFCGTIFLKLCNQKTRFILRLI